MNFNQQENIYLRKNCEIHDIYPLDNYDIILLIYFNNAYYIDRIKLQNKRDLIKLEINPVYVFRCGSTSLSFVYRQEIEKKMMIFNSSSSLLKKSNINFKIAQELFSFYFKETQQTLVLGKSETTISCYLLNSKQEICGLFNLKENLDQIEKLIYFQLNYSDTFIYSVIQQQDSIIGVESNGKQRHINSQFQYLLNGCAQQNSIIFLFYTPSEQQSSIVELVNDKNEQIKVVDYNQNGFLFFFSIEYVLFQNDEYICCRVSTDQQQGYQQIWVLDKLSLEVKQSKIYENEILQCICEENLQIDQGIGLYEREKLLNLENEEQEIYDENEFDDFSEIKVSFNLNPFYQMIKVMIDMQFQESIIIDVCKKLEKTQFLI